MASLSRVCSTAFLHRSIPTVCNKFLRKFHSSKPSCPFGYAAANKVEAHAKKHTVLVPSQGDLVRAAKVHNVHRDPYLKSMNMIDEVVSRVGVKCAGNEMTFEQLSDVVEQALYVQKEQTQYELASENSAGLAHRITRIIFEAIKQAQK